MRGIYAFENVSSLVITNYHRKKGLFCFILFVSNRDENKLSYVISILS